jgi:NADPH-ferrihemoprotein reductase
MGLCSQYISALIPGSEVSFSIRQGKIRGTKIESILKNTSDDTIIGIGTGTGIAPIRSIIQQIYTMPLPSIVTKQFKLIHGCRFEGKDNLYSSEWEKLQLGVSPYTNVNIPSGQFTYHPMYSQQFQIKRYVTHYIKENAKLIVEMLKNVSEY